MAIRCRPMQAADIPECVALVAAHPSLASRYGEVLSQLGRAWTHLRGQLAFAAVVFEEGNGNGFRQVALGTRAFLSDTFIAEIKTPPFRWTGPEIVLRVLAGESPLLSDKQVRNANSSGGLNLFAWDAAPSSRDEDRHDVIYAMFDTFIETHRGFLLKELLAESPSAEMLDGQLRSGGFLLDQHGQFTRPSDPPLQEIIRAPHFVGVSRDLAIEQHGTWIGSLFMYQAPHFGFSLGEQRLLTWALNGLTDAELADKLCLSLSTVKKAWRRIYEKVAVHDSKLIPDSLANETQHERGSMKKQRLLAYLREHIEELRPVAAPL